MSSLEEDLSLFSAISSLPDIPTLVIDSLKNVDNESKSVVVVIRRNLEIFTQRIHWIYLAYQDLNTEKNVKELQILNAFKDTVGDKVEELREYLIAQQQQEEMLLFQNAFMEKTLAVLSGVLEFEERLSFIFPDMNGKVMKIIDHLSIALLATFPPVLVILVQWAEILDRVKFACSEGNIVKQIEKLQEKVQHIQQQLQVIADNKQFIAQSVKLVTAIAEAAEVSPVSVAALGISVKNLEEINKAITKHLGYAEEVRMLVNLSEEVQSTSSNIVTSRRIVISIQDEMLKSLDGTPESLKNKKDTLRELIVTGLQEVQSYMEGAISSDKGIIEKLDLCYKAVSAVHKMTKQIDKEAGSSDVSAVLVGLVTKHTKDVIPKKFLESLSLTTLPPFKEVLKTSKVIQMHLEVPGPSSIGRTTSI